MFSSYFSRGVSCGLNKNLAKFLFHNDVPTGASVAADFRVANLSFSLSIGTRKMFGMSGILIVVRTCFYGTVN